MVLSIVSGDWVSQASTHEYVSASMNILHGFLVLLANLTFIGSMHASKKVPSRHSMHTGKRMHAQPPTCTPTILGGIVDVLLFF